MNSEKQIRKYYKDRLDIPLHKLVYLLNCGPDILAGAFGGIKHYGVEITEDVFEIFFEVVSEKLSGSSDIEYEFSEIEYENIMKFKNYCKKI